MNPTPLNLNPKLQTLEPETLNQEARAPENPSVHLLHPRRRAQDRRHGRRLLAERGEATRHHAPRRFHGRREALGLPAPRYDLAARRGCRAGPARGRGARAPLLRGHGAAAAVGGGGRCRAVVRRSSAREGETLNPTLYTLNPKPETRNPTPYTLYPKP